MFGERLVVFEEAVRAIASSVNDPLGDALVVEVEDLLPKMKIFQQGRPSRADPQRVLIIRDQDALLGGQRLAPHVGAI